MCLRALWSLELIGFSAFLNNMTRSTYHLHILHGIRIPNLLILSCFRFMPCTQTLTSISLWWTSCSKITVAKHMISDMLILRQVQMKGGTHTKTLACSFPLPKPCLVYIIPLHFQEQPPVNKPESRGHALDAQSLPYSILGLERDNGKENGSYYIVYSILGL